MMRTKLYLYMWSPSELIEWIDKFEFELNNAISFNSDIVLTGDFSMNILPPCKPSQKWLSILETYNIKQIVNEPTRVTKESKTLIDHIYITNLEKLQKSHVVQYSVSDHYPVCMTRSEQISVKKDTHISIVYRNYKKIVESEFLKDLSYAPFNKVEYVEDPNDALKIWYNFFNEILNKHAPIVTKRVKRDKQPEWYNYTNSPILSTPYRTDRELFWIKELGTAMPYGCNDNIKGVGNLSSPGCNEINVMSLFNTIPRTKRSHGHKRIQHPNVKKSSKPRTLQDTFNDLLSNIQKPLGIHHIRTILFSLLVNYLKDLRDFGLDKGGVDPFSPKYKLSSIICDVASFRLFKPVRSEPLHDNNRKFLHIPFANKGIDAINISNILNRKEVVKEIPPYFKNQSVPIVSYSYTNSIGRGFKVFYNRRYFLNFRRYLKN